MAERDRKMKLVQYFSRYYRPIRAFRRENPLLVEAAQEARWWFTARGRLSTWTAIPLMEAAKTEGALRDSYLKRAADFPPDIQDAALDAAIESLRLNPAGALPEPWEWR